MYQCLETSSVVTAWRAEWATGIEWAESRVATTRGKMQKRAIPQQRIIAFKQSIVPKMRSPALCIKIERVDSFPCSWWFPNIIIEIIIPLLLPLMCMLSRFSQGQLFATAWTAAWQPPLGMGFSRQEYWSGLPCPPPGDLPNPGIKPTSLVSPILVVRFFTTNATWETLKWPTAWVNAYSYYIIYWILTYWPESVCMHDGMILIIIACKEYLKIKIAGTIFCEEEILRSYWMLRIKSMSTLFFAESIHHNVVTLITQVVMELMILQELKAGIWHGLGCRQMWA